MKHPTISSIGLAVLASISLVSPATASLVTEYFTYSGDAYSNTAVATGWISFDVDVSKAIEFSDWRAFDGMDWEVWTGNQTVKDISVTVTGASSGNGTFVLSDFVTVAFSTKGVPLDFSKNLVGQTVPGRLGIPGFPPMIPDIPAVPAGPWGTQDYGIFNFGGSTGSASPSVVSMFVISSKGGEQMQLTSMTSMSAIPEVTSSFTMLGLISSGLLLRRRAKNLR